MEQLHGKLAEIARLTHELNESLECAAAEGFNLSITLFSPPDDWEYDENGYYPWAIRIYETRSIV